VACACRGRRRAARHFRAADARSAGRSLARGRNRRCQLLLDRSARQWRRWPSCSDQGATRTLQGQADQPRRSRHQQRERNGIRDECGRGQELNKLPETPVAKPAKEQPKTLPPNETKTPVQADTTPSPKASGGSGSVVQLGAFANQAQAERAWTALSTRFPSIAALNKMIVPFPGGIRLRAGASSPADAKQVCQTLKAAGENCFVAQ